MLRKFFSVALTAAAILFFASGLSSAASNVSVMKVSVILEPPVETFNKSEKVFDAVQQTVTKIFKNSQGYNLIPIDETAGYIQIYREENEIAAETFLKQADLDKICKRLESDFVIYLRITGNEPKTLSESIIGAPAKVVLDFRIWANEKQSFTYTKRITKNDDYSFEKSLNKCLQEVEKDSVKVREAM